jgi:hypothetical protein
MHLPYIFIALLIPIVCVLMGNEFQKVWAHRQMFGRKTERTIKKIGWMLIAGCVISMLLNLSI